jgi:RES domain-containing protein
MRRRLVRCVPYLSFQRGVPPTFLYTSGRPNRWNPRGTNALYFSEDEATANLEYARAWRGTRGVEQPKLVFRARVRLRRVLDLAKPELSAALAVNEADHSRGWRLARRPTRPQEIGRVVNEQALAAAIRYPSAVARADRREGWNVVIFPGALTGSDAVEILGDKDESLETLAGRPGRPS